MPDPASRWRALAEKACGATLETLTSVSSDRLPIEPLYPRMTSDRPRPWRAGGWSVAQRVDDPNAEAANQSALADLNGGADSLALVFAQSPFSRGFGFGGEDLDLVLTGVDLDFISLRIDAGAATITVARKLATLVKHRRLTSASLAVDLGFDPVGLAARTGSAPDFDDLARIIDVHTEAGLGGRPLLADGRSYHEAGAGEAQELAAVLATGVSALRGLETAGIRLGDARGMIAFLIGADADVFLGIAKARALRLLWARVEAAVGLEPKPIRMHVETSWRMMTRRDPWTNVMRTTAAAFAAGVGGADSVTVLPFTLPCGLPDDGARRLARNIQRVLIDEAHLAIVDDPAGGAGALESLTDALCERSWALFQDIERDGGIAASLGQGKLQADITAVARKRAAAVATLEHGIVGTSRFPAPRALDARAVPHDVHPGAAVQALPSVRDAEPFEALLEVADALTASGARPRVFLVALGNPARSGADVTYAENFFAAGGIGTILGEDQDMLSLATAFQVSGAATVCACGSDGDRTSRVDAVVGILRGAGAERVLLTGRPGASEAAWRKAGVDAFIYDGCDALEVLADVLKFRRGVPALA